MDVICVLICPKFPILEVINKEEERLRKEKKRYYKEEKKQNKGKNYIAELYSEVILRKCALYQD